MSYNRSLVILFALVLAFGAIATGIVSWSEDRDRQACVAVGYVWSDNKCTPKETP